jgi:hypothetical protein
MSPQAPAVFSNLMGVPSAARKFVAASVYLAGTGLTSWLSAATIKGPLRQESLARIQGGNDELT